MRPPRSLPRCWTVLAVSLAGVVGAACSSGSTSTSAATDTSADVTTPNPVGTTPSNPTDSIETTSGVEPDGFTTVQAVITDADGDQCDVCLWLADTAEERGRGLMGVTDLGDAAGMAFLFPEPTTGAFYMFQTPTPLSIAWFTPDGDLAGSADMAPCLDTPAGECPLYSPHEEYDLAVEVFEGGLEPLGIASGVHIELVDGSEADHCPLADGDASVEVGA